MLDKAMIAKLKAARAYCDAQDDSHNVVLVRNYNNGGPAVFISPAMQQANKMLAVLEDFVNSGLTPTGERMAGLGDIMNKARSIIAKAKRRK